MVKERESIKIVNWVKRQSKIIKCQEQSQNSLKRTRTRLTLKWIFLKWLNPMLQRKYLALFITIDPSVFTKFKFLFSPAWDEIYVYRIYVSCSRYVWLDIRNSSNKMLIYAISEEERLKTCHLPQIRCRDPKFAGIRRLKSSPST